MKKLNQRGFGHVEIMVIIVVVLTIGVAGVYGYGRMQDNKEVASLSSMEAIPIETGELITVEKIAELAVAGNEGATIVGIELEQDGNVLVYKVKLSNGKVLTINATTGDQIKVETDDDDSNDLPSDLKVGIEFSKAIAIARAQVPGVDVVKVEIEDEDGKIVYSVKFKNGSKVLVNAENGDVVKSEIKGKKQQDDDDKRESSGSRSSSSNDDNDDDGESRSRSESDDDNDEAEDDDDEEDDTEDDSNDDNEEDENDD